MRYCVVERLDLGLRCALGWNSTLMERYAVAESDFSTRSTVCSPTSVKSTSTDDPYPCTWPSTVHLYHESSSGVSTAMVVALFGSATVLVAGFCGV